MKKSKSLKNKKMPEPVYDAEVWDSENENLLQGYEGSTALCDAINYSKLQAEECNIYYRTNVVIQPWLQWVGPRPVNPPGR